MMDDYRTRRLEPDAEEPDSTEDEQEETTEGQFTPPPLPPMEGEVPPPLPPEEGETPPPLPPVEDETPPPLPLVEDETPPPLPSVEEDEPSPQYRPDLVTPPPLIEEEEAEPRSPVVFYQAPSEPQERGGSETVTPSPSGWYAGEQAKPAEVPSPFEEPVITPGPAAPRDAQARPFMPQPVAASRGGGAQAPPPPGPGAPAKKNQTALIIGIVIAVLVLLCCCCIIAIFGLGALDDAGVFSWLAASLPNLRL
jgi:hypothetical protein